MLGFMILSFLHGVERHSPNSTQTAARNEPRKAETGIPDRQVESRVFQVKPVLQKWRFEDELHTISAGERSRHGFWQVLSSFG